MSFISNNELIAKFMGWYQESDHDTWFVKSGNAITVANGMGKPLTFDSDWNQLMPVIEKIESKGYFILENSAIWKVPYIEDAYKEVIVFLKMQKLWKEY